MAVTNSHEEFVTALYRTLLKREPDEKGFAFFVNALQGRQMTREEVEQEFVQSPEYQALHNTENRVQQCWDSTAARRAQDGTPMGWLDSLIILEHYTRPKISGDAQMGWLPGVVNRFNIPPNGHWLSLGCGSAGQEIIGAKLGLFATMDAYDLSEQSINIARENAAREEVTTINFQVGDFHTVELPSEHYDAALMVMSLHHVAELESLYARVRDALKPRGVFIANEYVGPAQMQFTEKQVALVNELLHILPTKYRYDYALGGTREYFSPRSRAEWNIADPSEAIRSDEIVPLARRYFATVERVDYGGTLLNPLLEHIIGNFAPDEECDVSILRLLAEIEDALITQGCLSSNFAVLICHKE